VTVNFVLADIFILISAAVFSAHNSQLVMSLRNNYPSCREDSLDYGYGFIITWFAFIFYAAGAGMAYVNIRINKD